jgi:hypothetical protein
MSGYIVKPRGVVSAFKYGGYVVYEIDGHGLVVSIFDVGKSVWEEAKTLCADFEVGGYTDWYLPTKEDLQAIHTNLYQSGVGGFKGDYWSSSEGNDYTAWIFESLYDKARDFDSGHSFSVRAVRVF